MALKLVWVGFILFGFGVALLRTLQGDLTIFSQVLSGLFDTARTGFDVSIAVVLRRCCGGFAAVLLQFCGGFLGRYWARCTAACVACCRRRWRRPWA